MDISEQPINNSAANKQLPLKKNVLEIKNKTKIKNQMLFNIICALLITIILISVFFLIYFIQQNSQNSSTSNSQNDTKIFNEYSFSNESNQEILIKINDKIKIKHYINETLVYKKIKKVHSIMEIDNENSTRDIITTSYILLNIYDMNSKNVGMPIYLANLLVLNSSVNDGNVTLPSAGINILEYFEKEENNQSEINDNINIDNEYGKITEIEFNNFEQLKNYDFSEYIPKNNNIENDGFESITNNINSNLNIPIMNFSFYENGKILEVNFAKDLDNVTIQLLNGSLYEIIPDISQSSNLRILNEENENENETTFEKENKDNTYINGFALKNSEIYSVSNNTIDNEKESLSKITSFGNAKFESDDNDQIDDDNDENNPFKSENVSIIPNGIKKMVFNETSETILVYSSRNEKISEIIKIINQNITYVKDYSNEKNDTLRLLKMFNISEENYVQFKRKLKEKNEENELDKFKEGIEFSFKIFKINLFGVKFSLGVLVQGESSEGIINVQAIFSILDINIPLYIYSIKSNVGSIVIKYINSILSIGKKISEKFESIRILIKNNWLNAIKENFSQLSKFINSVYDISKLYNGPIKTLTEAFINSAKYIFDGIKEILNLNLDVFKKINFNLIKEGIKEIKEMLEDIRTQYLKIINNAKEYAENIQNFGLDFIKDINQLIQNLKEFDLSLMYVIYDQLLRPVEFLNKYERNLFNSIKKGINEAIKFLLNLQNNLIGDKIGMLESIMNGLLSSPILKQGVDLLSRLNIKDNLFSIINEVKEHINIIKNKVQDNYLQDINTYGKQLSLNIEKNITFFSNQSNLLIKEIKSKIESIELMELYVSHLDIIDSIENNILLIANNKFYELFSSYQDYHLIYKLNEELITNSSKELKLSADNIISFLKNEVNEMRNRLENIKIDLSEKYRLKLGDIAFHLIEIITPQDLEILEKNYYNLLDSALETIKNRDESNYNYLYNYLNNVVNEYKKEGSSKSRKGAIVDNIYNQFQEPIREYEEWISENFESILKKNYFYIYNSIINTLDTKIFNKIDFNSYTNDEHLYFLSGYIDYLQKIKDLIHQYISESIYSEKVRIDITQYIMNFSNSSNELYNKGYELYKIYNSSYSFYYKCSNDYCYQKKNPKRYRIGQDWWTASGWNVAGRNNYNKIVKTIPEESFDNFSKLIYDDFIKKYMPTIDSYSSLIKLIDDTVINAKNAIYSEFLNSIKFKETINNYIAKVNVLVNQVLGKSSIENIYNYLTTNIRNKVSKFYSNINSVNIEFYNQFYQKNFKDSFLNYLQKPNEILYKFEKISKKLENIGNDFESNVIKTLNTQLNTEIQFLYNKFSDILNENFDYILKNIPSFDYEEITNLRKNSIKLIPNSLESILTQAKNNISSITGLSNILSKNSNDFFEIGEEIKKNSKNLLDSFSIPLNYIQNDISTYIPKKLKETIEKNSVLTKIYQGKYAFDILKKFSDEISENDILKNFKISNYISLFKEFVSINYTTIINDINQYLEQFYPSILSEIDIFFDQFKNDIQGLYTQNIMNLDILNMTLDNFIKNGFNVTKWQNESIEISLENYEKKIHDLFLNEKNKLLSGKQFGQFIFNETNMNITYFKIKNNLLNPIRNLIYNSSKYSINLNVIHCLINQTQTIMRKNSKEFNKIVQEFLLKKGKKILILNHEINITELSMDYLWSKIFDYSNGIFFNYTKYFRGIKNLKIDISGIKEYLIEKEERLSIILDDEYYYLLNEIRSKSKENIGEQKEEDKYIYPENENEEEDNEEEEEKKINFNPINIHEDKEDEEEKFESEKDKILKQEEEDEKEAQEFCNECEKNITENNNNNDDNNTNNNYNIIHERCSFCNKSDDEFVDENEEIRIRRLSLNKKILRKLGFKNFRKNSEDFIQDFSNDFNFNLFFFSDVLTEEFIKIFSNQKITENILKNITQFNKDFFEVKINFEDIMTDFNIDETIEFIQNICNQKMDQAILDLRQFLDNKIIKYFNESIINFEEKYGKPFIESQIQTIIENNLTQIFNFMNDKVDEICNYILNLTNSMSTIPQLTYIALLEVFDYIYNYIEDNINYFSEKIVNDNLQNLISNIANDITDYYSEIITSSSILKQTLNENILDSFNSVFTRTTIEKLKKIAIAIFQNKYLGSFISQFQNNIKNNLAKIKTNMKTTKKNKLKEILLKIQLIPLESIYDDIYNLTLIFKNKLDELIGKISFVVENLQTYYSKFINENILPPVNSILEKYEKLTNYTLKIINDTIEKFEDLTPMVAKNLDTENLHKTLLKVEDTIEKIYDTITETIRNTIFSIAEFILNKIKDIFEKFNQIELYNKILGALKGIKTGEINISENINKILNGKRIRRLSKFKREKYRIKTKMRRTSILNFNIITKPIKSMIDEINNFISTFKSLKQFIQLIGDFSRFKELILYGITHIKDPLNYLLKQIESYMTKEQLKNFENRVLQDMSGIIELYKYHRDRISSIFEKIISLSKIFPELFSTKIVNRLFDTTLDTIISLICDKIIETLNPITYYKKSEIPPVPIFDCIIPIFFIPFRFSIDMLFEYEYGIKIHARVPKLYFGGGAGASATIRAKAGLFLGILEFGVQIKGMLGSGNIELYANYNLKHCKVGLSFYYEIRAFEFGYGGYFKYPWIEFIKIKIKVLFYTITIYFPKLVMKSKELEGSIYKGIKISQSYEKEL